MEADFEWFVNNYLDIYKLCGKCFVLIAQKRLIGVYQNRTKAIECGNAELGQGNFIVQFCDGTDSAYTSFIAGAAI